jgi:biopolymer transport protein ExbB
MATQATNWFTAGGIVMLPLLAFSILSATLIFERVRFWASILQRSDRFVREFLGLYRRNQQAAFKVLDKNTDLPMARIFAAALQLDQPNTEEFRLALETAAQAEIPQLKRFTTVFETIINLSPLLGLLGTVLGLIKSFASIKTIGRSDRGSQRSTYIHGIRVGRRDFYAIFCQHVSRAIPASNGFDPGIWWAARATLSSSS